MTRCQTDRMHNDGSSRQHGRQQRAWPGHGHKTRKGRPLAGLAGAWSSLAFFADPSTAFFFRASLARQRILRCLAWTTVRDSKRRAATSPTAAWRQASKGAMYQAMHCYREKQGIQQTADSPSSNSLFFAQSVRCKLHLWPALAG